MKVDNDANAFYCDCVKEEQNPVNAMLRLDRMPSIWCPGCGVGTSVNAFARALKQAKVNLEKTAIVSGIGCSGRVSGYLNFDSFHTTHGRAIPFATGLKLANPELNVVVYSGEGDLIAIGGNHFIHAARRNMDLLVICVNNFTYGMTGGQVSPTSPASAKFTTAPFGQFEEPFNLPNLAESAGAVYVARWTTFHVNQLAKSMREALNKRGFRFIEVISPCPTLYQRRNKLGDGLDAMKYYVEKSVINNNADTREIKIDFQDEITVGTFVNKERPTFLESMNARFSQTIGASYQPYPEG
ncbi:MAG: 2-oxoacid:ferredoxin oxidoreductase subunit beta [Deltaproteobacteria bacterium]|nr:2-oxoacid:ferredoxin oxidoreductase subunit beta [Deltaproteobacteria bacterium]